MGLSSERALALAGALRAPGSGLAAGSKPSFGLTAGRAPGNRLAIAGNSVGRAFLVSPSFIILAMLGGAAGRARPAVKQVENYQVGSQDGRRQAAASWQENPCWVSAWSATQPGEVTGSVLGSE